MLTITSKLQYDQARKESNLLKFEQVLNANELDKITSQLASVEQQAKDAGYKDSEIKDYPVYQELVAKQTEYDTRNDSIATQLELLDQDMDSFLNLQKDGIQDQTTFCVLADNIFFRKADLQKCKSAFFFINFYCCFVSSIVFSISIAIVIGPTPFGTGVM